MSVEIKKSTLITGVIITAVVLTLGAVGTAFFLLNNNNVQPGSAQNNPYQNQTRVPTTTTTDVTATTSPTTSTTVTTTTTQSPSQNTFNLKVTAKYGTDLSNTSSLTDITSQLGSVELFNDDTGTPCTGRDLTQNPPRCPRLNKNVGNEEVGVITFPTLSPNVPFYLVPRAGSASFSITTANGETVQVTRSSKVLIDGQLRDNVYMSYLSGTDAVSDAIHIFSNANTTLTPVSGVSTLTYLYTVTSVSTTVPLTTSVATTTSAITTTSPVTTTTPVPGTSLPNTGIVDEVIIPSIAALVVVLAAIIIWKISITSRRTIE